MTAITIVVATDAFSFGPVASKAIGRLWTKEGQREARSFDVSGTQYAYLNNCQNGR